MSKNFIDYLNFTLDGIITEGGNASVDGIRADRINLDVFSRKSVTSALLTMFKGLDSAFSRQYQKRLWESNLLDTNEAFNGSSRFFFDKNIPDDEYKEYKSETGDIDITVDKTKMKNLMNLLVSLKGRDIVNGCKLLGTSKDTIQSESSQIHGIFELSLDDGKLNIQVDFEGSDYIDGKPTIFAKFSHSSNWDDIKNGYKGVAHKFLLRALARALKPLNDVVLVTPASTYDKYKISNAKRDVAPSMLAFSVDKGLRNRFEKVKDHNGNVLVIDGKPAYKELLDTSDGNYITDLNQIFYSFFGKKPDGDECGLDGKFSNFQGLLNLIGKYCNGKIKNRILDNLMNGIMEQALVRGDPEADMAIKIPLVGAVIAKFGLPQGEIVDNLNLEDKFGFVAIKLDEKDYIIKFSKEIRDKFAEYYSNYEIDEPVDVTANMF